MDLIRNRYNPEVFYNRSLNLLDSVSKEEALSWYSHPCTQSLLNSLEGDLAGIVVMWLGGGYSEEESSSATAQKQAKARGMAQAIDDILTHLNDIKNLSLEGESLDDFSSKGTGL
jgi:uncharacterized protein YukE